MAVGKAVRLCAGNAIVQLFQAKTAVRAKLDREAFRVVTSDD